MTAEMLTRTASVAPGFRSLPLCDPVDEPEGGELT